MEGGGNRPTPVLRRDKKPQHKKAYRVNPIN